MKERFTQIVCTFGNGIWSLNNETRDGQNSFYV